MNLIAKLLRKQKGSAMMMALAMVLILTSFGTIILMVALGNTQTSAMNRKWHTEYVWLDQYAEETLSYYLGTPLADAERDAKVFIATEKYKQTPTGTTGVWNILQSYLNLGWLGGAASADPDNFSKNMLRAAYYRNLSDKLTTGTLPTVYVQVSSKDIVPVADEASSNARCEVSSATSVAENSAVQRFMNITPSTGWINNVTSTDTEPLKYQLTLNLIANDGTQLKKLTVECAVRDPAAAVTRATAKSYRTLYGNPIWTQAMTAKNGITIGGDSASDIQVSGDIAAFGEKIRAEDNTYSVTVGGTASKYLNPEDAAHFQAIEVNGTAVVAGNMFTRGNIRISSPGASLSVGGYTPAMDMAASKKIQNVFAGSQGQYHYLTSKTLQTLHNNNGAGSNWVADDIREGSATSVPSQTFLFKDSNGGNVYANSIEIAKTGVASRILIYGNAWMFDDVQVDADDGQILIAERTDAGGTKLTDVTGNLIGINSVAGQKSVYGNYKLYDPNASSAVINNSRHFTATDPNIVIEGHMNIPGTAFWKFDTFKAAGETDTQINGPFYYQTAESIGATRPEIFSVYADDTVAGAIMDTYQSTYTVNGRTSVADYMLNRFAADGDITAKVAKFITGTQGLAADAMNSRIRLPASPKGYNLGAVFSGSTVAAQLGDYQNFQNKFSENREALFRTFMAKTESAGAEYGTTFNELVSQNAMAGMPAGSIERSGTGGHLFYYPTDGYPVLSDAMDSLDGNTDGVIRGIIYSAGNLTLNLNGKTFEGTIVCNGDLKVYGSGIVNYNEADILSVIEGTPKAFTLFNTSKGRSGTVIEKLTQDATTETTFTSAGSSGINRRYRVFKWTAE